MVLAVSFQLQGGGVNMTSCSIFNSTGGSLDSALKCCRYLVASGLFFSSPNRSPLPLPVPRLVLVKFFALPGLIVSVFQAEESRTVGPPPPFRRPLRCATLLRMRAEFPFIVAAPFLSAVADSGLMVRSTSQYGFNPFTDLGRGVRGAQRASLLRPHRFSRGSPLCLIGTFLLSAPSITS